MHIYVLLFNIILDKGIIPESWGKGILIPILKTKVQNLILTRTKE